LLDAYPDGLPLRWRVENDYRDQKDALGLDHHEGRFWPGWHHHLTLVSAAHLFCTLERLRARLRCRPSADIVYAVTDGPEMSDVGDPSRPTIESWTGLRLLLVALGLRTAVR
jgi:hypothetical protein